MSKVNRKKLQELSEQGRIGPARAFVTGMTNPYIIIDHHGVDQGRINNKMVVQTTPAASENDAIDGFLCNVETWLSGRDPSGIVWRRYPILSRENGMYRCSARVAYEVSSLPDFELTFEPSQPKKMVA